MKHDSMYVDGVWTEVPPIEVMTAPYCYQTIRTMGRKPTFFSAHCRVLENLVKTVFGYDLTLSESELEAIVKKLFERNHYPSDSIVFEIRAVMLDERILTVVMCDKVLIDEGYVVLGVRPKAEIIHCEMPFGCIQTSMMREVLKIFYNKAIIIESNGTLRTMQGYPLYGARGKMLLRAENTKRVGELSMERVVESLGVKIAYEPLLRADLSTLDELFAYSPEGIISISECCGVKFTSFLARRLVNALNRITQ